MIELGLRGCYTKCRIYQLGHFPALRVGNDVCLKDAAII